MNILITGATGNVGYEIIKLFEANNNSENTIFAGVRNIEKAKKKLKFKHLLFKEFDFENPRTFPSTFKEIDILFLLRPPQISDVKKFFTPIIQAAKEQHIKHIIFLSVQGADKTTIIPHHKIEKLITESKINYTFLRPSYFMQNLSTTLKDDIQKGLIFLPAGKAKFNYIDIMDIATVCNKIFNTPEDYINKAFTLTGSENYSFPEIILLINDTASRSIRYKSPNPFYFLIWKTMKTKSLMQSFVILMLHYIQRFQKEPEVSDDFEKITGRKPEKLVNFIRRTFL